MSRTLLCTRSWLLSLLVLLGACQDDMTLLVVTIMGREGVPEPAVLESRFIHEKVELSANLSKVKNVEPFFPATMVIQADGRSGPVELAITARDDKNIVVGEGSATTTLLASQRVDLELWINPSDFAINTEFQYDQIFSTSRFGPAYARQISSAADGSFVSVWVDETTSALSHFYVYYRLFDRNGVPRLLYTGKADQNTASGSGADVYDMPTVAMQPNGRFVTAWQRSPGAWPYRIYSRAFTAEGKPDPNSEGGNEIMLTGSEVTGNIRASAPCIAALRKAGSWEEWYTGGSETWYVVVWQQENGPNWEVKGRLLGENGTPTELFNAKNEPFTIVSFASGGSTLSPSPTVAGVPDGGFMVVWNERGDLKGRAFAARGSPIATGTISLAATKTGKVRESTIASLPYGYAVAWSDSLSEGEAPDQDGMSIRFRRFNPKGEPYEEEYTLNTSHVADQAFPAIASRSDGNLLVAWTTFHNVPDPEGGIRARKVLVNGLPVGNDFAVNTTSAGLQEMPCLTHHSPEGGGFIVGFVDGSKTFPDTMGKGIRARIVFPDFSPIDGQLGAICDQPGSCAEGFLCSDPPGGKRCLATCDTPNTLCPYGGKCRSLVSDDKKVCVLNWPEN